MRQDRIRRILALIAATIGFLLLTQSAATAAGEICGGFAGIRCDAGLWCDQRPGMCNGRDIQGVCVRVTKACTREYRPVCGCDGKTYGNDCGRRAARVFKRHDGPCRRP